MLETEEVDDDFFTPQASTSLANIFGNGSKSNNSSENDSLKYIPPKPQSIMPKKKEVPKATECVFACALVGHEWCNNVYTSRGKLGLAILNIQKTGDYNIVLYDSNKTTLSNTNISQKLEITIKNNTYISYYDGLCKYWSLYGTKDEINKIAEALKNFGANVNHALHTDKSLPDSVNTEITGNASTEESEQQNKSSDTDSSVNRKTKTSILNRICNLGHSVLPARSLPAEISSDSSDINEMESQPKSIRHKPGKTTNKRNNVETMSDSNATQRLITAKKVPEQNLSIYHGQFVPMANTYFIPNSSSDFGMFTSEQRVNNSELRVNLSRITDKVDSVLNIMNTLENKVNNTHVKSNDFLVKLLEEYEYKNKAYSDLLKSRGKDDRSKSKENSKSSNEDNEGEMLKKKISNIEKENENKTNQIVKLQKEIKLLKDKCYQQDQAQANKENELISKINGLENDLKAKTEEIADLTQDTQDADTKTSANNDNIADKMKNIMNETFQTIALNFNNDENYTGETVKRIVGTVIKKITIQTVNNK